jgi:hypothetical protein
MVQQHLSSPLPVYRPRPAMARNVGAQASRWVDRDLWVSYVLIWLAVWLLHVIANLQTDVERGNWRPVQAMYQASWLLWPAIVLGLFSLPLTRNWHQRLLSKQLSMTRLLVYHGLCAIAFTLSWSTISSLINRMAYGEEFANATLNTTFLWQWLWGLFMYTGVVLAFTMVLNARAARASLLAAAQADAARVQAELSALRGKLNPHFLFNTLNTLIALTRRDAKLAEQNLLRFSNLMRQVLDNQRNGREVNPLEAEIEFARDYLELEQLRLGNRLKVQWQIDERSLDIDLPALSLQPLIENSIVHGIAPKIEGGTITIESRIEKQGTQLCLIIRDDGVGTINSEATNPSALKAAAATSPSVQPANSSAGARSATAARSTSTQSIPKRKGLGLSAVRQRFEMFAQKLEPSERVFSVKTAPGQGFEITIVLPI